MWKTHLITNKIPLSISKSWISTGLLLLFTQLFHSFLLKKDINLLILHQK